MITKYDTKRKWKKMNINKQVSGFDSRDIK